MRNGIKIYAVKGPDKFLWYDSVVGKLFVPYADSVYDAGSEQEADKLASDLMGTLDEDDLEWIHPVTQAVRAELSKAVADVRWNDGTLSVYEAVDGHWCLRSLSEPEFLKDITEELFLEITGLPTAGSVQL
jgi:hypothetical protein